MAPMTRRGRQTAPNEFLNPQAIVPHASREESWQLEGDDSRSERELSENPSGSFQDYDGEFEYDTIKYQPTRDFDSGDSHEDILHPLREAANRVGREVEKFAEVLDGYNPLKAVDDADRKDMTFDLIDSYHGIAIEAVKRLRAQHKRRQIGQTGRKNILGFTADHDEDAMDEDGSDDQELIESNPKITPEDLKRWEQEARTWDLLRRMTILQYGPPQTQDAPPIHRYSSERHIWTSFLQNDTLGLERHTVLEWLKNTADESGEDIDLLVQELQQNAERGDITAHGWLHTKSAIKNQKRLHAWPYILDPTNPDVSRVLRNASKTEALVTQLDPDAPIRQNLNLEAPDQYFERAIWRGCYELLRRGKSGEDIREWCQDRQEIWRAVSMSGFPDDDSQNDTADHGSRALWRRMCHALAKRGGSDIYETAVYGILAGDFWSVAPICKSWDDQMFVHYNSLIRSQYEAFVLKNFPSRAPQDQVQSIEAFDAISFHGDPVTVGPRTVDLLNAKPELIKEAQQPLKMLQGVLIANTFRDFIREQGIAISKAANAQDTSKLIDDLQTDPKNEDKVVYIKTEDFDSLRVLAHMVLAFKSLGMTFGNEKDTYAIESVVVAYISFLRLAGKEELIPLYAAQLSDARTYSTLSRELLDVTDPDQRITQIKLMKELGLDVQRFVRLQAAFLLVDYPDQTPGYPAARTFSILVPGQHSNQGLSQKLRPNFIGNAVARPEALLIRAFEWHLLVDGMWSETFRTGTALFVRFFKHGHVAAARELAGCMPSRDIAAAKTPVLLGETLELSQLADCGDGTDLESLLRKHMADEARAYVELEGLVNALDFIEGVAGIIDSLQLSQVYVSTPSSFPYFPRRPKAETPEHQRQQLRQRLEQQSQSPPYDLHLLTHRSKQDERLSKKLRLEFHNNFANIRHSVAPLLDNWLVKSRQANPSLIPLHATYLPPTLLAYAALLNNAGLYISRDHFLESMELASVIATNTELTNVFLGPDAPSSQGGAATEEEKEGLGRNAMADLVQDVAGDAVALLFSTGPDKSRMRGGRRAREGGWKGDVWGLGK
ncbi:nuclear pore complex subunit [Pseudogymnoascus destructans]|uniref:Nuclear pore complex protein n=1 Tax=Pseudogymnoascus destructans TaxID=655981 RepID=A0A177AFT4_9PEZI|nr:nuclear pore complex subunit [Pseudogymnoascus destructans]OAF60965.1 nuclear pore complex subunit [Pseudogymnoascus destructans]